MTETLINTPQSYQPYSSEQPLNAQHWVVDLWQCDHLTDKTKLEAIMRQAAQVANANLLHLHLHKFGDNGGVTGVAVLAESHISVHTWPELDYAAFDIFMCGDKAKPEQAIKLIKQQLNPQRVQQKMLQRGSEPS